MENNQIICLPSIQKKYYICLFFGIKTKISTVASDAVTSTITAECVSQCIASATVNCNTPTTLSYVLPAASSEAQTKFKCLALIMGLLVATDFF